MPCANCPALPSTTQPAQATGLRLLRLNQSMTSNVCPRDAPKTYSELPYDRWEPYIVTGRATSRGLLPRYNEMFVGRGYNKIQWVATLRAEFYRFYTAAAHFLVHTTHPLAQVSARKMFIQAVQRRRLMQSLLSQQNPLARATGCPPGWGLSSPSD